MTYDEQILYLMAKVGDRGLSVNLIAKHLYNLNSSLFFTPNIENIKRYVRTFLAKNSQTANSIILKMDKKGCYKLNPNTPAVHQLMIDFSVHNSLDDDEQQHPEEQSNSNYYHDSSPGFFD